MPSIDAPDWQRVIVTVQASGDVPDAPDWERIVAGPGGTPVGGGGAPAGFAAVWTGAGMIGVTMEPMLLTGGVNLLGGSTYMFPFVALATASASTVWLPLTSSGTYTSATSYAGLYDFGQASAGHFTLLASTPVGAAATAWDAGGETSVALASSVPLTQGQIYNVAITAGGATLPALGVTLNGSAPPYPNFSTKPLWCGGFSLVANALPASIAFTSVSHNTRNGLVFIS